MLNPGDTLLNGQYEIRRAIGRGGFGFVYLAHDRLLGEPVAIKNLVPHLVGDEAAVQRFLAEARATMRLTSERIVRTYNVFSQDGSYYIAMEYVPGGSLAEQLAGGRVLPLDRALRMAEEVCEGLHYAHRRGVIHCDLKPSNILFALASPDESDAPTEGMGGPRADPPTWPWPGGGLAPEAAIAAGGEARGETLGAAKVADFGIAHISDRLVNRDWHTQLGFAVGTVAYMAPEQAAGVRDDPRLDVYAMGAVLYQAVTGRSYLDFDERDTPGAQADNVMRIRQQPIVAPSARNPAVPAWLDAAILKALSKRPDGRFATADEFRAALLAGEPAAAVHEAAALPAAASIVETPGRETAARSWWAAARRQPAGLWALIGGIAALSVALLIGIAVLLGGGGQPPAVTRVVAYGSGATGAPDSRTPGPAPAAVTQVVTPEAPALLPPAGQTGPLPAATDTPAPTASDTPAPAPTATRVPPAPAVLYRDDFSDAGSGWGTYAQNNTEAGYQDGEYRLAVYRSNNTVWNSADPPLDLTDADVSVDVRLAEGPAASNAGLLVRYQPSSQEHYWFMIDANGAYAVSIYRGGKYRLLLDWQTSPALATGPGATNRLRVVSHGSRFTFYANGTRLAEVSDGSLASGNVGLAAGAFDEAGPAWYFDNLVVREAP